ncbi:MAG: molybdopterin biosynthesis protein, partial [Pseudolabrys sp.]
MSESRKPRPSRDSGLIARVRAAARQEQFLEVVSAEEARVRFERHLDLTPLPAEAVALADARTRVLAHDVVAAVDAPPFDRSNVDGFAVRAADIVGASDGNPKVLTLNDEVIACGHAPVVAVAPGTC